MVKEFNCNMQSIAYVLYYTAKICIDEVSCKSFKIGVKGVLLAGMFYALGQWLQALVHGILQLVTQRLYLD